MASYPILPVWADGWKHDRPGRFDSIDDVMAFANGILGDLAAAPSHGWDRHTMWVPAPYRGADEHALALGYLCGCLDSFIQGRIDVHAALGEMAGAQYPYWARFPSWWALEAPRGFQTNTAFMSYAMDIASDVKNGPAVRSDLNHARAVVAALSDADRAVLLAELGGGA